MQRSAVIAILAAILYRVPSDVSSYRAASIRSARENAIEDAVDFLNRAEVLAGVVKP